MHWKSLHLNYGHKAKITQKKCGYSAFFYCNKFPLDDLITLKICTSSPLFAEM